MLGVFWGVLPPAALAEPGFAPALARIDSLHVARAVDEAAAFIAPLLQTARAENDSAFILPLTAKLGRLWASFGQPARGEPLLREAAELATARRDSLPLHDALRWLGYALEVQGRPAEAEAVYRRLLVSSLASGDRRHEGWARTGLGFQAQRRGRYDESEQQYRLAVDLFRGLADRQAQVWAANGLATVLQAKGAYRQAQEIYRQVAETGRATGFLMVEALAENNLGTIEFAIGDPGAAQQHFARAEEIQTGLHLWQEALVAGANRALCAANLGRFDEAAARYEDLLRTSRERRLPEPEAQLLVLLAELRVQQGRPHEAAAIFRQLLADNPADLDLRFRVKGAIGLADALAAVDSVAPALNLLRDIETQTAGQVRGEHRLDLDLALGRCLALARQQDAALARFTAGTGLADSLGLQPRLLAGLAGQGECLLALDRPDQALAILRRAARVWDSSRAEPLDSEWREARGPAGRLVFSRLAALLADDPATAFDTVQSFKARTLAERMGRESPFGVVTLDRLQTEVLRPGELLLDYYLGPEESTLFAVTRDSIFAWPRPAADDLAPRLKTFRDLAAAPPSPGVPVPPQPDWGPLADLTWGPARSLIAGASHVILVPDGLLNLAPLCLFDTPDRDVAWSRVPSASLLAALRQKSGGPAGRGILALAGTRNGSGKMLVGAGRETDLLAHRFRQVSTDLDSLAQLERFAVLHLASHARVDDQRPWASSIGVDLGDTTLTIQADQVAGLALHARLVVLSACSTGGGRTLSGEGVLGLSSAFLAAGSSAVVASLWPVDDRFTERLMDRFYFHLDRGQSVAQALALARRDLRQDPATASPFAWAGFVLIGDGDATVPLHSRPSALWPVLPLVLVVGAIALLQRRRRRAVAE